MHRRKEKSAARVHVRGCEHQASQRQSTQATRDEVERRIGEMLCDAEDNVERYLAQYPQQQQPSAPTATTSPALSNLSLGALQRHLDAASTQLRRNQQQQHQHVLPPLAASRSHQDLVSEVRSGLDGSMILRATRAARHPNGYLHNPAEDLLVTVSGNPLGVLRHCLKHFLANPAVYGKNVRELLESELQFVLSVWATSDTSPVTRSDGMEVSNIVQDNFFERLLRAEATQFTKGTKADELLDEEGLPSSSGGADRFSPSLPHIRGASSISSFDAKKSLGATDAAHGGALTTLLSPTAPTVGRGGRPSQALSIRGDVSLDDGFEVSTLRRQVKALSQMNATLSEQLNTKTLELREAVDRGDELQEEVDELEQQALSDKRKQHLLEAQLADMKASVEQQLLKVNNFRDEEEDKRRTTEGRLKDTKHELGQVYSEWKTAQNHVAAAQKELDRSVEECETLHTALDQAMQRLDKARRMLGRRNQTIMLMQELMNKRRESHQYLQQCVRELEAFAGAGTLTELYLAADPAWSLFLFYRLHRHVYHVTPNVTLAGTTTALSQLCKDTPLFIGTTEGGCWAVTAYSTEHLYRLVVTNNGTVEVDIVVQPHKGAKGNATQLIATTPKLGALVSQLMLDASASSPSGRHKFASGLGGCTSLQWATSPFQVHFEAADKQPKAPATELGGPQAKRHHAERAAGKKLFASVVTDVVDALNATLDAPTTHSKCLPIQCIESLLIPVSPAVASKLNVPANRHGGSLKSPPASDAQSAAAPDPLESSTLMGPFQAVFDTVEDTLNLRRSDARLILYGLWKERYAEHMREFEATRMSGAAAPAAAVFTAQPQPQLGTFITFVYRYLSTRFPHTAAPGGKGNAAKRSDTMAESTRRKSDAADTINIVLPKAVSAAGVNAGYVQTLDVDTVVVRCAVGDDKVGYSFLRSKQQAAAKAGTRSPRETEAIPDAQPADSRSSRGGSRQQGGRCPESVVHLSPQAKEVLFALIHFSYEYKEVDADFRLFYLVSHQLLPEAVAINFIAMTEAIYRDCDEAVLAAATSRGGRVSPSSNATPRRVSDALHSSGPPLGGSALSSLYQELPVTKVEMKRIDVPSGSSQRTGSNYTFDEPSSEDDNEMSIAEDASAASGAVQTYMMKRFENRPSCVPTIAAQTFDVGGTPLVSNAANASRLLSSSMQREGPASTAAVATQIKKSEVIHRNGLISLHEFISILETHCFASYFIVRATSPVFDWVSAATMTVKSPGEESLLSPRSVDIHMASRGSVSPVLSDSEVLSDEESEDCIAKAYNRRIARYKRLRRSEVNAGAGTRMALERVGYVPLTPMQAQRLKFALSLDQPSSVVKYAHLFRPEMGAARPSHFYDELLTMVMDHHLAVQEVLMDELILPSCACRRPQPVQQANAAKLAPPSHDTIRSRGASVMTNASSSSDESSSDDDDLAQRKPPLPSGGHHHTVGAPQEDCDGDISVEQLVLHAARWIASLDMKVGAACASTSVTPAIVPLSPGEVNNNSRSQSFAALGVFAPVAAPSGAKLPSPTNSSAVSGIPPYLLEVMAKRFVLQLAETCPKDNVSSQFMDAVVSLANPTDAALPQLEGQHESVCAALEQHCTLPLHYLAAKIRTTFVVFEVGSSVVKLHRSGATPKHSVPVPEVRRATSPRSGFTDANASNGAQQQQRNATHAVMSRAAFQPPDKELLNSFRAEMSCLCEEAEKRITTQRSLFNAFVVVLPDKPREDLEAKNGRGGARKKSSAAVAGAAIAALTSLTKGPSKSLTTPIDTSSAQRFQLSEMDESGGVREAIPTFRSLYALPESVQAATNDAISAKADAPTTRGPSVSAAVAMTARKKSITEAVTMVMDAVRLTNPMSYASLPHVQDTKSIPLELSVAAMLKRQLAPKFPPQLLPALGDLQVYHKALMTALLKPIDDITAAHSKQQQLQRKPSNLKRGASMKSLPGGSGGTETDSLARKKSELSKAGSFALKRLQPLSSEAVRQATEESGPPSTDALPAARRRLGSIAMGMLSSMT